jgi:acyl dehydratase
MTATEPATNVGGPFYEDLEAGLHFDTSPGLTITDGHAALHQAIVGDRLRLALDHDLAAKVIGPGPPLVHPNLVCDVAIGQSTLPTHRVIGNLFYRGLVFRRAPRIGDTLRTSTEIVALRDTSPKPDRPPTGLVVLRVRTRDQHNRAVLDFYRCAMLPMRPDAERPGHADDLGAIPAELDPETLIASVADWDLEVYRAAIDGETVALQPGARYVTESGDTVSNAPELVRLSLNIAAAHSDPAASGRGRRLVYGGHTIGIACSHATRALPNLVTVVAWRSCDHTAPVFEGDVLRSEITVEAVSCPLVELRVETTADRGDGSAAAKVLDWRLTGVIA